MCLQKYEIFNNKQGHGDLSHIHRQIRESTCQYMPFSCMRNGTLKNNACSRSTLEARVTNSEESLITSNAVIGNGDLSLRGQTQAKLYFKSIKPQRTFMIFCCRPVPWAVRN